MANLPDGTSPQQLLQLEYERFVEFGQVLDRTGRRYLVEYIRHRLEPDRPLPHDLDDAYFRYFREALAGVLSLDALVELCRQNAGLRRQVATDTLRWLRLTYQELRTKHPYGDEVSRLESWAITPEHLWAERWPLLTTFLEGTYAEHELPVGFFKERFKLASGGGPTGGEPTGGEPAALPVIPAAPPLAPPEAQRSRLTAGGPAPQAAEVPPEAQRRRLPAGGPAPQAAEAPPEAQRRRLPVGGPAPQAAEAPPEAQRRRLPAGGPAPQAAEAPPEAQRRMLPAGGLAPQAAEAPPEAQRRRLPAGGPAPQAAEAPPEAQRRMLPAGGPAPQAAEAPPEAQRRRLPAGGPAPQATKVPAALLTDLLAQWDALLHAKILAHQLDNLKEKAHDFQELMAAKVQEYTKLVRIVSPFSDYLAGYWDMSRGLWQDTSFDVLEHYADLLAREDELRELADLLGQWREAEIELEEETLEKTIVRQEWVSDETLRSEISGVHESADLSNVLSSEVALFAEPDTESAFLKRFAERQLLTFRYDDRKLVTSTDHETEVYNRVREKERGPFILCVDTSESMSGRPEQVAKVLALGILKMAGRVKRRAYLISFSTGIQTLDLHDVARSLEDIAAFLRMSFRGGTDISLPLYECFRQLRGDDYRDADVLVISDFIMYKLDADIMNDMRHFQHNKGTEFHALVLGEHANGEIVGAFDTTWAYDGAGVVKRVARELLA